MKITSKDFADVLMKTSFNKEERKAIADLLSSLSIKQIEELYKILLEDARDTQKILNKLKAKKEKALLRAKQDFDKKTKK